MAKSQKEKEKQLKKLKKKANEALLDKLQKDLQKLGKDWEDLLSKKKQASDLTFLDEMAEDIKNLNDDATAAENEKDLDSAVELIHHMLTTPWGAPFVSDKTLLEAAIAYENQAPLNSDLFELMRGFNIYSTLLNNQFLTILESISEDLTDAKKL